MVGEWNAHSNIIITLPLSLGVILQEILGYSSSIITLLPSLLLAPWTGQEDPLSPRSNRISYILTHLHLLANTLLTFINFMSSCKYVPSWTVALLPTQQLKELLTEFNHCCGCLFHLNLQLTLTLRRWDDSHLRQLCCSLLLRVFLWWQWDQLLWQIRLLSLLLRMSWE